MNKILQPLLLIAALFLVFYYGINSSQDLSYLKTASSYSKVTSLAAFFFAPKMTPEDLKIKYLDGKLKIMIVPGHEENYGGTEFKGLTERELNVKLANYLFDFIEQDKNVSSLITKNSEGKYFDWFKNYIALNKKEISDFREGSLDKFEAALDNGFEEKNIVYHNSAPPEAVTNLYGVNKYANDNDIDLVVHIHFNDYPRRSYNVKGKYTGFSIYIPETQLPNHKPSKEIAEAIGERLKDIEPPTNNPVEKDVIIEDQGLIAVGSNASRDGASVLIEYGYIYEPQLRLNLTRDAYLKELAYQTYLGIEDYFNYNTNNQKNFSTLPYKWQNILSKDDKGLDVLALQLALVKEDIYALGNTPDGCPVNGYFGDCTQKAVSKFQEKYDEELLAPIGLKNGTGKVGRATLSKLNELYSK